MPDSNGLYRRPDFGGLRRRGQTRQRAARQISIFSIPALLFSICILFISNTFISVFGAPTGLPAGWTSDDVLSNVGIATDFLFLPDERMLILLKAGRILMAKGNKITAIAADLTRLVGRAYGDRGLLGAAVHPEFGTGVGKDWIYVGYVWEGTKEVVERYFGGVKETWGGDAFVANGPKFSRLSRFTLVNDTLDPASEVILLGACTQPPSATHTYLATDCIPMIGSTHSIDWLEFGPDGNLWVSVGDGQAWEGTDWFDWLDQDYLGPMSLDYLGGKMLRLDENGRGVPGNPWYRGIPEESRGMIWARGVRQGWRCDFIPGSPLDEIELLCGNVGWYSREAVLRISKGGNLGWPCFEGAVPVPYFFYNGVRINATDHPECGKYYRGETEGYKGVEDVQPWDVSGVPYAYEHAGGSAAVTGGIWVEGIPMPENVEVDEGAAEGKTSTGGLRPTVKMAPNLGNLGKATKATLSILKKSSSKALSLLKESTTGTGRFVKATPRLANARTSSKPVKRQVNSTISNFNVTSNSTSEPCFLFADFVRSTVYCLPWNFTASQPIGFDATKNGTETYKYVNPIKVAEGMDQPVTFRRGPDGNVWVLGHCVSCSSYGVIRRLIPPGGNTTLPYGKDVAEPTKGAGGVGMVGPILSGDACYPKDKPKVVVPELPKGWEPIIYFPKFPNILYYRNGLGPIEINAAVGGAAPLDGSLLSVAGVWYQRGLGTRTVSEVHLPVLGYCHRVYVEVGIDDQTGLSFTADPATQNKHAMAEFVVKADGHLLFNLSARMGTHMRAGDLPQTIDIIDLQYYSDLGFYGYKPMGNSMKMDESLNFLAWGEAKMYCGPDSPYLPSVDITYPEPRNLFGALDTVVFSGIVKSYDDSSLPDASYQWYVNLIHCQGGLCHTHFYENFAGVKNGAFKVESHGLTSSEQYIFYEIKLVGTDLCGRSNFAVRNVIVGAPGPGGTPMLPPGKIKGRVGRSVKGLVTDVESVKAGEVERMVRARRIAHARTGYEFSY